MRYGSRVFGSVTQLLPLDASARRPVLSENSVRRRKPWILYQRQLARCFRKLVINKDEAELVRQIFRRFERTGNVRRVKAALDAKGFVLARLYEQPADSVAL